MPFKRMKTLTTYTTSRFGEIQVNEEKDIIVLPEGLIGFAQHKRFVLLEDPEQEPFLWFQSLDDPNLAFVLVDPLLFFPDYKVQVPKEDVALLGIEEPKDARVLVLVVVDEDPAKITANLKGPVVLNPRDLNAKQVVLMDDRYHTQHRLLEQIAGTEGD